MPVMSTRGTAASCHVWFACAPLGPYAACRVLRRARMERRLDHREARRRERTAARVLGRTLRDRLGRALDHRCRDAHAYRHGRIRTYPALRAVRLPRLQ